MNSKNTIGWRTMADEGYSFKVALVGNSNVGKTALFLRYTDGKYSGQYQSTVGVDMTEEELTRGDNTIKLQLWDTAGQEKYKAITTAYFRGTDGFILVFDLTAAHTLEAIEGWYKSAMDGSGTDSKAVLVGNKSDMTDEKAVTDEEIQAMADKLGVQYFETSVKDKVNVKEPFDALVDAMLPPPPEPEPEAEPEEEPEAEPEAEPAEKPPAKEPEKVKPTDETPPAEKPSEGEKVDLSAEQHPRQEKCGC